MVVGVEDAQRVDRVAEQLDADRLVRGRRKDVDDAPAAGDLAGSANDVNAAVAQAHRGQHETIGGQFVPSTNHAAPGLPLIRGRERMQQRTDRQQQDIQLSPCKAIQGHDPLAADFGVGRDAVVGIGVERRKRDDAFGIPTEQRGECRQVPIPGLERRVVGYDEKKRFGITIREQV